MAKDTSATKSKDRGLLDKSLTPTKATATDGEVGGATQMMEAATAGSETIPVETKLGIVWRYPPGITPRTEFIADVEAEVLAQIPAIVRNSWKIGDFPPIKVDSNGHKLQATTREYVVDQLQTVNQKRPSQPLLSLSGGSSSPVTSVRYVWAGGGRVAVYSFALNMGEDPWQVTGDPNLDPPAQMEFQVSWVWDPAA